MIGRLIIKYQNKVYSVMVNANMEEEFDILSKRSVVNIHFVNNEIMRLFRKDYVSPFNTNDKSLLFVNFLGKTWILTNIYFVPSVWNGDTYVRVTLKPAILPPELPPVKFVPNVTQDLPMP